MPIHYFFADPKAEPGSPDAFSREKWLEYLFQNVARYASA